MPQMHAVSKAQRNAIREPPLVGSDASLQPPDGEVSPPLVGSDTSLQPPDGEVSDPNYSRRNCCQSRRKRLSYSSW